RRAAHARAVGAEADARHLRLRPRDRRVRRGRGVTSPQLLEGEVSARGRRIAIIAARFNDFIVASLLKGALGAWVERGGAASELAVERAATSAGNKGGAAMESALEMAGLMARL